MCGIIGVVGGKQVGPDLVEGLKKMEYRGYDSAGIALQEGAAFRLFRELGHVVNLEHSVQFDGQETIGIGHTRWATHGQVSVRNTHPHLSYDGAFAIVHNGVIENYKELRQELMDYGVPFASETDTEVIVNLIAFSFHRHPESLQAALLRVQQKLQGIYSFVLMAKAEPNVLYALRNRAPLLIGHKPGAYYVASDMLAMAQHTNQFYFLDDGEMARLTSDHCDIYRPDGTLVHKQPITIDIPSSNVDKGPYDHYMLKEIHEQPFVLRRILSKYADDGVLQIDPIIVQALREADSIQIIACGTSYHAGLVGKLLFEKVARKKTEVHIASEFSYQTPLLSEKPAFLLISQSGETADLRLSLDKIKELRRPVFTITNVIGSTLAREADAALLLYAGPEIAVASTKAYTAQISLLALLAQALSSEGNLVHELTKIGFYMEEVLALEQPIKTLVEQMLNHTSNAFYLGRGIDYALSLEAALKLKEISYLHAEGYPSGELKHGPIALIEQGTPVFGIITQLSTALATRANMEEVRARGAKTATIVLSSFKKPDDELVLPDCHPLLTPLLTAIVVQYIAYYAAILKGTNVDKPRNLAKSVTVE